MGKAMPSRFTIALSMKTSTVIVLNIVTGAIVAMGVRLIARMKFNGLVKGKNVVG